MSEAITTDVVDQLATALEEALDAADVSCAVRRGSPVVRAGVSSNEEGEASFAAPLLVVMPGDAQRESAGRADVYAVIDPSPVDAEKVRVIWRRGRVVLPLELWLYTLDKTSREPIARIVERVLEPLASGEPADLFLSLPSSYDATARVWVELYETRDEEMRAEEMACALWRMRAAASLLEHADAPRVVNTVET